MKAQKTIELKTVSGKAIEAIVTYTKRIEEKTIDADGMTIETGKNDIFENIEVEFVKDGKKVDSSSYRTESYSVMIHETTVKGFNGIACGRVLLSIESGKELKSEIAKMVEENTNDEAKMIKSEKAEEIKNKEVEEAKAIIEKADAQKEIPTRKESEKMKKEFNDIYNEGGYGYVPEIIDLETYEMARKVLEKNNNF